MEKKPYKNLQFLVISLAIFLTLTSFSCNNETKNVKKPTQISINTKAIILIHGLMDNGGLNKVSDKLAINFPEVQVIALNRTSSKNSSIPTQAKEIFNELKEIGLNTKDIILIGDSQGGLVAWELYNTYKEQLNVRGIITNHTPWLGTPAANIPKQEIKKMNDVIASIINHLPTIRSFSNLSTKGKIHHLFSGFSSDAGIKDLESNSVYLQKVRRELPTTQIPILFLGGEVKDFSACIIPLIINTIINTLDLPADSPVFKDIITHLDSNSTITKMVNKLQKIWNNILGSSPNDLLVPLDSQLANGVVNGENFQRHSIPNYHHYVSMTTPVIYSKLIDWITETFNK